MPKLKHRSINLLPQDDFEISTIGRILKWALSTFRLMVIATEIIVMSAFLSRFWLDARNSDLNEELGVSSAQVAAYSEVETTFRTLQKKLAVAKQIYAETKSSYLLKEISMSTPPNIILNTITINEKLINIKASTYSENSIAQMLVNMNSNKNLKDVSLKQISSDAENSGLIVFNISATINSSSNKEVAREK